MTFKEIYTNQRFIDDEKIKIPKEEDRTEAKKTILEEKDYLFASLLEGIEIKLSNLMNK